jgi:hypothetical protein
LGGEIDAALKCARGWLAKADTLNERLAAESRAEEAEFAKQGGGQPSMRTSRPPRRAKTGSTSTTSPSTRGL